LTPSGSLSLLRRYTIGSTDCYSYSIPPGLVTNMSQVGGYSSVTLYAGGGDTIGCNTSDYYLSSTLSGSLSLLHRNAIGYTDCYLYSIPSGLISNQKGSYISQSIKGSLSSLSWGTIGCTDSDSCSIPLELFNWSYIYFINSAGV